MKRGSISLAPKVRDPGEMDFDKYPIKERFSRLFVENMERMALGSDIHRVLWALMVEVNADNVVNTSGTAIAIALDIPVSSAYYFLKKLEKEKTIVRIKKGWWMIDPSLVYSGPSKYHRAAKMQYRIFVSNKPKDNHLTNHEGNQDEQCDLQARSGDPDPAHDAARAECA